ncbi:enoyl-CoA hydratase/isomerase family protein [Vreelandella venusta]|uniref:Enoyl-CoA hydratase/isomerase family protein n=1 Tax=Vreelandella venusta TaxID=44935 RepID=A0AAP9ZDI1_9GAMM|nr:enoyl-CoA hydratase/isomerase family protein [Halomonas venusta]QRL01800.1 enoyl-CoA hydratase/isomerase family protein [Halomonas venusta]WAM47146.1 enoyl-CoA hydratase/isomerase family protein [Halomonas venusta]GEK52152.1 gamma-carboxygeranoyl-CoA hydratase [Halomonas venusta]
MAYSTLLIEEGVARLTLNRPEVHNAFDDSLIAELNAHLDELHALANAGDVRVVVLGSEGKSFSAGADLNWMKRMVDYGLEDNLADSRKLSALMFGLDTLPCPTVCRVQGAAFGGAVGLAACCDLVVASDKAKFCLSEVKIGLSPAVISPYVQRALGERQMRRYALTAEVMDAPTAMALGLVHQVVEHDALDSAIDAMLDTLLGGSPQAQRATKALLASVAQAPNSDATREHTCQVISKLRVSQEGQEGLASFFEKRRPAWTQTSDLQEHNTAAEPRS